MEQAGNIKFATLLTIVVIVGAGWYGWYFYNEQLVHSVAVSTVPITPITPTQTQTTETLPPIITLAVSTPPVPHIATPAVVTGIYISGWSAGTASSMAHINSLLAGGKLDAVVIDIKDATGRLSYEPLDPTLRASGVGTNRIADLAALIQSLHAKHVYIIGRIEVFQDQYYPTLHPEDALQDKDGGPWKDPKGLEYLQANNTDVWHYTERIAEDAYAQGFDEINLDYVRFPSDGELQDIDESMFTKNKEDTIADFFTDVDATLRQKDHIPLSADIFGLTMSAKDDMGIGQKLELIAPHVDYVCPMIYPSHFSAGSYGFLDPVEYPYQVIHQSLTDGMAKLKAANIPVSKLRPWLQDFSLGTFYTPSMVQAQITATNDVDLPSWLMWDAGNIYTSSVYK